MAPTNCSLITVDDTTTNGGYPVEAESAVGPPGLSSRGSQSAPDPHRADDPDTLLALSTVTAPPGEVLVVAVGEIDLSTGPGLQFCLTRALGHPSCRTLIVDLSRVGFMGAFGVGVLASTGALAMAQDVRLAVVADHRPVLRPLHINAGNHGVETFPTLASARIDPGARY